jgi:hypothetical protein
MTVTAASEDDRNLLATGRRSRRLGADGTVSWRVALGAAACGEQGPAARVRDGARAMWQLDKRRPAHRERRCLSTRSSSAEEGEMRRRWGKYLHPNEALAAWIRATPGAQCRSVDETRVRTTAWARWVRRGGTGRTWAGRRGHRTWALAERDLVRRHAVGLGGRSARSGRGGRGRWRYHALSHVR